MKFEVRRERSEDIDVYSFDFAEEEKPSIWKHWKVLCIAAVVGSLLTGGLLFLFCKQDFSTFDIAVKNDRSTTVILRSKDEQERNGKGSDGIAPTSH